MDDLPLLKLFTRLREAGLPLGMDDYESLLQAVQAGYGLPNRTALARLCKTLWVRSDDELRLFNYYFEQLIGSEEKEIADTKEDVKQTQTYPIAVYAALAGALILGMGVAVWLVRSPGQTTHKPKTKPVQTSKPQIVPTSTPIFIPKPKPHPAPKTPQPPQWLIWSFLLILALSAGYFWLVRLQMNSQRPRESSTPDPNTAQSPEWLHNIKDEVQVAQSLIQATGEEREKLSDRFLLSGDYLPITGRQMKQSWRHMRRMVREGVATELDVEATINQIGRYGILLQPVLMPRRVNRTELLLLIDREGSMVPFHLLSQRLAQTAQRGGRLGESGVYYFHNCPVDYLYHDPHHIKAQTLQDALAQLHPARTVVLIFSDAGAARGGLNPERIELTERFIQQLKQHVRYVAWLNPMPKKRWLSTTAAEIADVVPMFEISRQGLDNAIAVLRGRSQFFGRQVK